MEPWIWIIVVAVVVTAIVIIALTLINRSHKNSKANAAALEQPQSVMPRLSRGHRMSMENKSAGRDVSEAEVVLDFDDDWSWQSSQSASRSWHNPYAPRYSSRSGVVSSWSNASSPMSPSTPFTLISGVHPSFQGYTIVLDLDETLLHSTEYILSPHVETIPVPVQGDPPTVLHAHLRPFCRELLQAIGPMCELVLWTAGTLEYASIALNHLDTTNAFQHRVCRDPSWFTYPRYTKALRWLGRDMDRVVLVDNTEAVCEDVENSIVIEDFRGDPHDRLMIDLRRILTELVHSGQTVPDFLRTRHDLRWSSGYYRLQHRRSRL